MQQRHEGDEDDGDQMHAVIVPVPTSLSCPWSVNLARRSMSAVRPSLSAVRRSVFAVRRTFG
ncbi:hypothetical protein GCM10022233_45440 [Streptomyces shaanxiensis]|uniref:Uncharacterized protein n=1 Tax=Streptomyces shaanxiensis TaxID=653357 RepID=A0ABP7VEF8_9ACTN